MMTLADVMSMVGRTLRNPREGAAQVLSLGLPRDILWVVIAIVSILSTISTYVLERILLVVHPSATTPMTSLGILSILLIQIGILLLLIAVVQRVGRAFGGTAVPQETTILMCWFQFVMMIVAIVQNVIAIISPILGFFAILATIALNLWLLTHFIAVLHGFRSLGKVFVSILLVAFVIAIPLAIIFGALGLMPVMPAEAG